MRFDKHVKNILKEDGSKLRIEKEKNPLSF